MLNFFYQSLETISDDERISLSDCIKNLIFNHQGLIPVITQCFESNHVLMHAWMNQEAIEKTLETRRMTYWSRSRNQFWVKGKTSGHTQELVTMYFDCDGDILLCLVKQTGPACHTGRPNCFYLQVDYEAKAVKQHFRNKG